ncbi:MAG: YbbR-like domain-containing protein [Bacteroidota bacterium]
MKKKIITISLIAVFSIILWASVSMTDVYVTTIRVPVNFTDLPRNYSIGYSSVNEIYLQVKGRGWELAKLSLGRDARFNVSVHRRIGKRKNDLKDFIEANAWLTSSFQVLEIAPSIIEFDVERTGSKHVKLIKNFKMEFKPGYGPASEIKINPEFVEIFGPANLLQNIDSLKTEYREFLNVSENVKIDIPIETPDGISLTNQTSTIEFEVQKIVDKTFEEIPVETFNVPAAKELILYPGKINIVLRGGIDILGRLTNDSIKPSVDFWNALREENGIIEPTIIIPRFTTIIDTVPKKLEYIIKQH